MSTLETNVALYLLSLVLVFGLAWAALHLIYWVIRKDRAEQWLFDNPMQPPPPGWDPYPWERPDKTPEEANAEAVEEFKDEPWE